MGAWIFNPGNPRCMPTAAGLRKEGIGTGDVSSVVVHWVIDVELAEPFFHYYPEAAGRHVLYRRLVHDLPNRTAEEVDFEFDNRGIALWEARPASENFGIKWRLAYNYDWTFFGAITVEPGVPYEERAWTLWHAPEYWRAPDVDDINVAFPLYSGSEFCGAQNRFDGVRPNELRRHSVGNNQVPGVFLFDDFPATITLTPWWP